MQEAGQNGIKVPAARGCDFMLMKSAPRHYRRTRCRKRLRVLGQLDGHRMRMDKCAEQPATVPSLLDSHDKVLHIAHGYILESTVDKIH